MFEKKGLITIDRTECNEDDLMEIVLEAGAEDLKAEGDTYEVITAPAGFEEVKEAVRAKGIEFNLAEITMVPKSTVKLDIKSGRQVLKLVDALEDHDDVQHVYSNFDIPDEVIEQME
jgi:transcriptional/translational regulatory protein YebC/TACO1